MGEKTNAEMTLFYVKAGGFEKVETITELPTITTTYVDGKRDIIPDLSEMNFTAMVKISKRFRCKSRKRFIKLLMSKGVCRDSAVRFANIMRKAKLSYSDAWFRLAIGGF